MKNERREILIRKRKALKRRVNDILKMNFDRANKRIEPNPGSTRNLHIILDNIGKMNENQIEATLRLIEKNYSYYTQMNQREEVDVKSGINWSNNYYHNTTPKGVRF